MRLLHIHSGNLYGGVETLLTTLARHHDLFPALGSHFALCFEGRLCDELQLAGAAVYPLGKARISQPLTVMRARRALSELLQREHFDLAVCHSSWSQTIFGPVVRAANLPLVYWLHNPTDGKHWLDRWARKTAPDLVLCNSEFTGATAKNLYPERRSEVVYCPVAPPSHTYSKADRAITRTELQTPQAAVVIIQVSRMEEWKGQALQLEALGELKDLPDWICWQAGGAQRPSELQYLNRLKKKAEQLQIADRVRFLGQRSDVEKLLAAADIYCQPNTGPEPFGIAFIEALHAGLPVVTTEIGGAREIVDNSCGRLVKPRDKDALAQSLRGLIRDQVGRVRFGAAGPVRARALCDVKTQMQLLHECFAEVVAENPRQARLVGESGRRVLA